MNDLQLRPAQEKILEHENGRLAISAVPGSGKTFTLSLPAAKLIGNGRNYNGGGFYDGNRCHFMVSN
jgi:superfamily I DNA/RNA helicase